MEQSQPSSSRVAAIYARVSTDNQRARGTVSSQVDELRELAVARGLVVGPKLVFCDEGVSGATLVRPALERLRDGAGEGTFDVVLCHSPDRLARRYAYQVLLLDELARVGVEVVFAFEDGRAETPEGELLRQMQGMIAEYERAQIAERTRRGRLHRARSGSPAVLGRAPYGYQYVRRCEHADAYFEIDEAKAGVVREIFRRYAHDGQTLATIAGWLNESQTPTTTPGKTWHPSTVRGMLVNPAYRGEAAFGKTRVTGARGKATRQARQRGARYALSPQRTSAPEDSWTMIAVPAIIDADTFALARSRLEQGVRFASPNAKRPSLLRGLLVCRECGYAWHHVIKGKPQSGRTYYQCGSRSLRTAERRCRSPIVRADELDQLVWDEITRLLCEPNLVGAEIDRRLRSMRETDPAARRSETLAAELTRAERAISRLVDAYQDEQITLDELRARMPELRRRESALRAERDAIEAEIDDAANYLKLAETIQSFTSRLTHGMDDMDTDQRARILRLLVRNILIGDDETVTIRHSIPLPPGGENPQTPLHTGRHGGCSHAPDRGERPERGHAR